MNCTALDVKTTVGLAFKYLFDPRGRVTSGAARCIDLVIPEGTCVNALPPDGAVFAYWEQSQTIISAVLRALAQAVGPAAMAGDRGSADIHNANGLLPDGTPWVSVAQCGGEVGPFGANRHGDADSQMLSYQANGIGVAAEAIESGAPVVVLRHEIVPDTAGAGLNRGGNAVVRDSLWLQPAEHHIMSLRYKRPSGFGVAGGRRRDDGRDLALGASPGRLRRVHVDRAGVLPRRRPGRGRARSRDERALSRRRLLCTRTACPRGTPRRWPGFATSRTAAAASAIRSSATPSG